MASICSQRECELQLNAEIMEKSDITSEASAENEVETDANTNLSLEDFASSFMEKVETEANESSTEATEDITETEVVDAEEEESEVLSQSNTETEDESEEEETDDVGAIALKRIVERTWCRGWTNEDHTLWVLRNKRLRD